MADKPERILTWTNIQDAVYLQQMKLQAPFHVETKEKRQAKA